MNKQVQEKVLGRVKRIAGQIGGVQRMIEQDRYCVDVLHQISAIRSALDALGVELLTNHLETCVLGSNEGGGRHPKAKAMKAGELVAEVHNVISRFLH